MVTVTGEDQNCRNNVVNEHLHVILPLLLDMNNQNLLKPESVLNEDVPFAQASNFPIGPVRPKILKIEPVVGVRQNILQHIRKRPSTDR